MFFNGSGGEKSERIGREDGREALPFHEIMFFMVTEDNGVCLFCMVWLHFGIFHYGDTAHGGDGTRFPRFSKFLVVFFVIDLVDSVI